MTSLNSVELPVDICCPPAGPLGAPRAASRLRTVRDAAGAVLGAIMGVLPHVLHHVGLIAGTALVAGAGGTALFFALGLLFSIPMLRRIYRRFGTWVAPAVAIGVFSAMFALSAFVIGPALTGSDQSESVVPAPGARQSALPASQLTTSSRAESAMSHVASRVTQWHGSTHPRGSDQCDHAKHEPSNHEANARESVTVNSTEKTNSAMPSWITRNFAYDMCLPCTTLHGFGRAPSCHVVRRWQRNLEQDRRNHLIRRSSSLGFGMATRPVRPLLTAVDRPSEIPPWGMLFVVVGDRSRERASGP